MIILIRIKLDSESKTKTKHEFEGKVITEVAANEKVDTKTSVEFKVEANKNLKGTS